MGVHLEVSRMCKKYDAYTFGIEEAKKHQKVSHYTTIDALKCILENKSLRLTRLDFVNDVYEDKRIDDLGKGKIFTACFTHRKTESNMFWNLYAKK